MRQLCKGNVAIVKAAILAGCRQYYGYPITPASEVAEEAALTAAGRRNFPAGGKRSRRHQHGVRRSCDRGARHDRILWPRPQLDAGRHFLPCGRRASVRDRRRRSRRSRTRNIAPEQSDYFCLVKGGGHGNYRNIVLAPASVQEMADLTILAFDLADRYRNPVIIMTDGFVGQMMEPVELEDQEVTFPKNPGPLKDTADSRKNLISSIYLELDDLEAHQLKMEAKYKMAQQLEPRHEEYEPTMQTFCWSAMESHPASCVLRLKSAVAKV